MMKRSLLLFVSLLLATLPAGAESRTRYIVSTTAHGEPAQLRVAAAVTDGADPRDIRSFSIIDAFAADLTPEQAEQLRRSPGVRSVRAVVERHLLDAAPSTALAVHADASVAPQTVPYGIDLIHAREVWPLTRGRGAVNVVIFDTGITVRHPDLAANIAGGYNAITRTDVGFDDDHGHGTHVAGTIAGIDNGIGVVGVAPEARLWSVKVLDSSGSGTDETLITAAGWVLRQKQTRGGNWIVSMSIGDVVSSPPEQEAFQRLADAGVLMVAASGNGSSIILDYPAAYPFVLSVGAVDATRTLASFSNGGTTLGLVAPGVNVLSSLPVGSVPRGSAVTAGIAPLSGVPMKLSARGTLQGELVSCGYGGAGDCPSQTRGRIAVIWRGLNIPFAEKVRNAVAAGATGVIIYDNITPSILKTWSLIRQTCDAKGCLDNESDRSYAWPMVIAMTRADGESALQWKGNVTLTSWDDDYDQMSGTSMATPHVAGVAALLWSIAPSATAADIRNALFSSAHDLGDAGYDLHFGHGLVDALDAAKTLAPGRFGSGATPAPASPKRRRAGPH